jgi:hypothetical protein
MTVFMFVINYQRIAFGQFFHAYELQWFSWCLLIMKFQLFNRAAADILFYENSTVANHG